MHLQVNASSPFGVVVGGVDVEERKRSATETARRDVAGGLDGLLGSRPV